MMPEILKKAIKQPKKAARVLHHRILQRVNGQSQFKKVIVIGRARTGSNLLLSYLNSHPAIHMEGEIFAHQRHKTEQQILKMVFNKQPQGIEAAGFKIFYHHPMDNKEQSKIWDILKADPSIHVIQLQRTNMLRMHISRKIAMQSDVWTASKKSEVDKVKVKTISFTKAELEEGFNKTKNWEANAQVDFANHPMLQIEYEKMISNPEQEFRRLTDFLRVEAMAPETKLRKQNPESLSNLIENYAELKAAFADTEWAVFFDE
ncbi:sulfotransferase domain-containing protein [Planctobacterium marinum]|uniref:sulfotransferase domain-containing protein n=1 Tax=Planctobacterium marinum TaxID=1631968 RepID=UPI001E4FFA2D|nr:sulfotransferase domain-containing protein [Planctobacterium marinum]MCC2606094.1 sulfotransferase domain-containing protein [Planctobacterium marinum]